MKTRFWTDTKVRSLSGLEKLVFLYLVTNPHGHLSGLYYLPLALAQEEIGEPIHWEAIWAKFKALDIAYYDAEYRYVWVKHMYEHQGKGPQVERAVIKHFKSLHPCNLLQEFQELYFPNGRDGYRVSNTLLDTHTTPTPTSTPILELKKRQKLRTDWPENFQATTRHKEIAAGLGLNLRREVVKFETKAKSLGWQYADWDAAFRNWLTREAEYKEERRK